MIFYSSNLVVDILLVLLDEQRKWEFAEEHLHQRQVLKKLLGHAKVLDRLLALFVHALTSRSLERESQQSALKRLFAFCLALLSVPDPAPGTSTGREELGRGTQLVRTMHDTRLCEFLMTAAGSVEEETFRPHGPALLAIHAALFSVFRPACAAPKMVAAALHDEQAPSRPVRHSNFSGSIVFRLSTGQDHVLRQGTHFNGQLDLDAGKKVKRVGGRRQPALSYAAYGPASGTGTSADAQLAKQLATRFLASSFNILMRHLAVDELPDRINDDRFHRAFLRLSSWFLQHTLSCRSALHSVFAVLDVDVLLSYARLLRRFHEECKKNGDLLMTAVVFFRDVLRAVELMGSVGVQEAEDTAGVYARAAADIQNALFYQMDLLTRFRLVLQGAALVSPSATALGLLAETVHVLLKLLERHCLSRGAAMIVGQARHCRKATDEDADSEDDEQERMVERRFEFAGFLCEWATEPVLEAYTLLLRRSATLNPPALNRYLAVMFYRLAVTASSPRLFHRIAFLEGAHRFLRHAPKSILKRDAGLTRVLESIVAAFVRRLREEPLLVMETFFPYSLDHDLHPAEGPNDHVADILSADEEEEEAGVDLPDALSREQKMRTLVRRLVDQEQTAHLRWLLSSLHPSTSGTDTEPIILVADSSTQKQALKQPAFTALLRLLAVRGPSASLKHWHMAQPTPGSLPEDLAYIRRVMQEALEEEDGPGFTLPPRKAAVEGDSEEDKGSMSDSDEDASDFSVTDNLPIRIKEVKPLKPVKTEGKKKSKLQSLMSAGFFNIAAHQTGSGDNADDGDDGGDGDDGDDEIKMPHPPTRAALPLAIEDDGEAASPREPADAGPKRAKTRIIDSDDE